MYTRGTLDLKKQFILFGIALLAFQSTASQQQEEEASESLSQMLSSCEKLFSFSLGSFLSSPEEAQPTYRNFSEMKKIISTSEEYSLAKPLDPNDTKAIRNGLDKEMGDGAAAITIELFDKKVAEKIREAMHQIRISEIGYQPVSSNSGITYEWLNDIPIIWQDWWKRLMDKLTSTGIVSADEIQQFKMELEQFVHTIKTIISKTDRKNIEMTTWSIRTEKTIFKFLEDDHVHTSFDIWLTASTSVLGPGTWVRKKENDKQKKSVALPGQAWLLSEGRRNVSLSNEHEYNKQLRDSAFHGTPNLSGKRLFILIQFKLVL